MLITVNSGEHVSVLTLQGFDLNDHMVISVLFKWDFIMKEVGVVGQERRLKLKN
jgi:hypothetical protein